ncbi:MAG: TlpA disulfide reductase family protein [Pseudomonadota bacterium]
MVSGLGLFRSAVLYTALILGANAAYADAALEELREGTMRKLLFHSEPQAVSQAVFTTPEGDEHTLADWQGKYVLLNFWATWCAPCRAEMPALDALQAEFGGEDFEVVTIATGRNTLTGINKFFAEPDEGLPPIENLPILLDPKSALASEMAVLGLPITVILNPEGEEIARMRGDAEWHSDSARAIIGALIAPES